jgi:Protein of unknown function (DUF3048) N-terminal domain/Protein of unknown function (DUF3048) C-terminal domain
VDVHAAAVRHRRPGVVLLLGLVMTTAAGCGSFGAPGPVASTPISTSATPVPPPPVPWPLTGVASTDETEVDRPALAVKIENSVEARPQTGLDAADLVWEEVVEGGITRYLAVYHSELPTEIGPVRSVRPMDAAIAAPLKGLFAFSGGQPDFVAAVDAAGLQVLSNDAGVDGFSRLPTRNPPHDVYADTQVLVRLADDDHRAAPPEQFDIASAGEQPTAVATGTPASAVRVTLSNVSSPLWSWRASASAWLRTEGSTPAVEADGSRLRATNVVVLRVDVVDTEYVDPAGNPVPETVMVGEGEALVATGGHTIEVRWSKASPDAPVILSSSSGGPVRLAPGTTWVELAPRTTGPVSVR